MTISSRIATTIEIGTRSLSAARPDDGHEDEQDLLGRVRGGRDGVGGEDRERRGAAEALVVLLGAGDRRPDDQSLQG